MTATPDALIAKALTPDDLPDLAGHPDEQPWEIDGRREAEWAIAKIRAAHHDYADSTAPAREAIAILQARIDELHEFIDREGARRDHTVEFFEGHLENWGRRERAARIADGQNPDKVRSFRLSGGTVGSRAGTDRVKVVAADLVVEWVRDDPDRAYVAWWEPKVDQHKLRAHIRTSGEVPPGVTVEPATEDDRTWSVKLT